MNCNSVESRFEDILSLVIARSRGEVGNEEVESALSSLIPVPASAVANQIADLGNSSSTAVPTTDAFNPNRQGIIQDTDNYDFDDKNNELHCKTAAQVYTEPTRKVGRPKSMGRINDEAVEHIPLGKMGSRMLITFGDGPQPRPEVVSAALLGARSSLQRAVLDARALHR
jgi:hypothetical protein